MIAQMLEMLSPMALAWLVALVIFAVAEAVTVSLVSIWFVVGFRGVVAFFSRSSIS